MDTEGFLIEKLQELASIVGAMEQRLTESERNTVSVFIDDEELKQMINESLKSFRPEMDDLRKKATQRGARMQLMRDWLASPENGAGSAEWDWFCERYPNALDWFDEDGVPR